MTTRTEEMEEAQELFDALSSYFMRHPEAPSGALLEAVDYVCNYLGDIAKGREYEPDNLKEAFSTAHQAGIDEAVEVIKKARKKEGDVVGGNYISLDEANLIDDATDEYIKALQDKK